MTDSSIIEFGDFAQRLADASREIIGQAGNRPLLPDIKPDGSPVTALDQAVEARLRAMISQVYPSHGIIGEEEAARDAQSDYTWVIDPIDGTLPFLAGIPVFGTLIALMRGEEPILGVIDLPATGERWIGAEGMPSSRNGEQIRARPCADLATALVSNSNPDFFGAAELEKFERLKAASRWTIYGGSCLAYAQLASGRIDVGIDAGLDLFDYCALIPVIRGAGGVITDWEGNPLTRTSGGQIVAAGDPRMHAKSLELLSTK